MPNILWICTDQQRFDTIRALGNTHIRTPNLDRLINEGVTFQNAYCQCPICTPSRASFLTGRYPRTTRLRQNGQDIPSDEVLVTKTLADSGYTCGLSGKLHLSSVEKKDETRIDDGYKEFYWAHGPFPKWRGSQYIRWLESQGKQWIDIYPINAELSSRLGPEGLSPEGKLVWAGTPVDLHHATWCTSKAIDFITRHNQVPWLFSVNFQDPHHPFDPPAEYLKRYDPDTLPPPVYREDELLTKPIFQQTDHNGAYGGGGVSFSGTTDRQHREIKAAYYGMIEFVDYNVGLLLNALEETAQKDRTIVIFMSDHGEMLGDHGIFLKGPYMYDPLVRVPLILCWPGHFKNGLKSEALVELIDLAPTILQAVGIPVPIRMQGRSFLEICKGEADPSVHKSHIYSEYYNAMVKHRNPTPYLTMFRDNRYKIVAYSFMDSGELYDMESDPDELDNLWDIPKYEDIRYSYLKKCLDACVHTIDPLPERTGNY